VSAVLPPTPVLDLLADAAAGLGPAASRLVAVLRRDPDVATEGPAVVLARAKATSSVLERLLANAGLADFEELRVRLAAEENRRLASPGARYGARLRRTTSAAELMARVAAHEQENLRRTLEALRADGSLETAARLVVSARRKYVVGAGKSQAYARLLATDLAASLPGVTLMGTDTATALDVLCDVSDRDVVLAFSLRRYVRATWAIVREFHAAGATVVAIVDAADAPLTELADVTILVSTSSASYADSPTAVAAVSHLLATLAAASAKGARRRLDRRGELARSLEVYARDLDGPQARAGQHGRAATGRALPGRSSRGQDGPS
jgi:DNA-binding MurR/RpiR family transcriptional regulator